MGTEAHVPLAVKAQRGLDGSALLVFRIFFGLLCTFSALRFVAKGWVTSTYIEPTFHFRYAGFAWLPEPGPVGLYALFGVMAVAGLGIATGTLYRVCTGAWLVAFVWVELLEEATYLNHYYLLTLLGTLVFLLPLHRLGGGDVRRGAVSPLQGLPAWVTWLFRGQVSCVYVYAGIAKLNGDWLLAGEPLHTWLRGMDHFPILGPWLPLIETALVMAWASAMYDLCLPFALGWRRTRPSAFCAVVVFHVSTWILFPIGVFPWLMVGSSTLFFPPDWAQGWLRLPHRTLRWGNGGQTMSLGWGSGWMAIAAACWMILQIIVPLRAWALPGDSGWTGRGFRFAWRVMLIEKTGLVEYRLHDRTSGAQWRVSPRPLLTSLQYKMLCTEQEFIHEFGRHLADLHRRRGSDVAVYADAFLSINGRPSARSVRADVDLSQEFSDLPHDWIPAQ